MEQWNGLTVETLEMQLITLKEIKAEVSYYHLI
jgi:hypothetical protein